MRALLTIPGLLLAALAPAQTWTQIASATAPNSTPAATNLAEMVFDIGRAKCVLFGGWSPTQNWAFVNDTWEYDGVSWTHRQPVHAPSPRSDFGMAYDRSRGVTVLYGGLTAGGVNGQTWEYDGTDWSLISTANSPGLRGWCQMVYDVARGKCVLFGGNDGGINFFTDTWEYDGSDWTQLSTANSPPPRYLFAMAYDAARNRSIVFGGWNTTGGRRRDTWEFDGADWTQVSVLTAPPALSYVEMAHDRGTGRTILFGGWDAFGGSPNKCWALDGTSWTDVSAATNSTAMTGRNSQSMCFDLTRNVIVMYGGYIDLRETWELGGGNTIPRWSAFGVGCQGSNGVPHLAPQGASLPALGTTFSLDLTNLPTAPGLAICVVGFSDTNFAGLPLPLPLGIFGLTGCTAYCDADPGLGVTVFHAGNSAVVNLAVPNNTVFAGLVFFNQAYAFDAGAANGKLANSNAGRGVVH